MDNDKLSGICNNNVKNMPSQSLYDSFNDFIFNKDIKVLGKFLHRFMFFEKTKHLAGDIVELGVFKGSGVATFIKFLEIFCTHSNKKVIGFDIFDSDNEIINNFENGETMKTVYGKTDSGDLLLENVEKRLLNINNDNSKFILVRGMFAQLLKNLFLKTQGFAYHYYTLI